MWRDQSPHYGGKYSFPPDAWTLSDPCHPLWQAARCPLPCLGTPVLVIFATHANQVEHKWRADVLPACGQRGMRSKKIKNSLNSHSDVNYTLWRGEGKGGRSISTEIISHLAIIRGAAIERHHHWRLANRTPHQQAYQHRRCWDVSSSPFTFSDLHKRRFRGFDWPALHQIKSIGHVVITQAVSHLLASFDSKAQKILWE